jgi:glycosyltransferase involved in cell wall biosynthesis/GT2 family glycosyltransferase
MRSLRVCFVTREFLGPFKNGGIGTAYTHMAHLLAALGHEVTVYYAFAPGTDGADVGRWTRHYAARGIRFVAGEPAHPPSSGGPNARAAKVSRQVYEWLKGEELDVVHVPEFRGDGYFALLAKRLGLAFRDTVFVVRASGPTLWCRLGNDEPVADIITTAIMHMERRSVEMADHVISPSRYMLSWMTEFGYALPEGSRVQPTVLVPSFDRPLDPYPAPAPRAGARAVGEIVYFARLEARKGLATFCAAVRLLERRGALGGTAVTLLGKGTRRTSAFVAEQGLDARVIDGLDSEQAVAYLRGDGRLACMPSVMENSPLTVYECLLHGIPFVASDAGGGPELVHPDDRAAVIFERERPTALADRLAEAIADGVRPARPAFGFDEVRSRWAHLHAELAGRPRAAAPRRPATRPKVSICMAHHNRPRHLAEAVESVRALSYPDFELIVTDDGSDDPAALEHLDSLEAEFASRGWRILRQENRYLGAARNTAARQATGEYLLFMDDDNLAKPEELDVFVQAAEHTGADVLTCFADTFLGAHPGDPHATIERETPVGDCLATGIVKNVFGDANALIRREVFEALGGFTEDYGTGTQDHELFLAAVVNGYTLYVVPEPLYWYRRGAGRMQLELDTMERGRLRTFRQVSPVVPEPLRLALRLAQGAAMELLRLEGEHRRLATEVRRLEEDCDRLSALLRADP